jgi:hypothetical protein
MLSMTLDHHQRQCLAKSFGRLANLLFFGLLLVLLTAEPAYPWRAAVFGVVSYAGLTYFSLWLLKGAYGAE